MQVACLITSDSKVTGRRKRVRRVLALFLAVATATVLPVEAQLASSAYRVLGQPDLRQNAVNTAEGSELLRPTGVALDARTTPVRLYVTDSGNHRVLGWGDASAFEQGADADLVLGQRTLHQTTPLGIGEAGFHSPRSVAVHPATGDLYVADTGNHRVLRFPDPFSDPSRVEPDAIYGQPHFAARSANSGGLSDRSLRSPAGIAFDRHGNLWIADTENHRVVRYPASTLDASEPRADLVLGQADLFSGAANAGGALSGSTLAQPVGLVFDAAGNLFVSDFANARVLMFRGSQVLGQEADSVLGQTGVNIREVPPSATASSLRGPVGLATDPAGALYVAVPLENRIVVFEDAVQALPGQEAARVLGQALLQAEIPNAGSRPQSSALGLFGASDVAVDNDGRVYVADSDNHRVLAYPAATTEADRVWGQPDFQSNGANRIDATSISGAYQIGVDDSQAPFPLYVSDTNNHRILVWRDSTRFADGAPADLVIGQPDLTTALANIDSGAGGSPNQTSLSASKGIALDAQGNLFVADSGNNRVLRYPRPTHQSGRITPDLVLGQPNFFQSTSAAVTASSLRAPSDIALGPNGTLFISDSGNNRVVMYAGGLFNGMPAVKVFGQPDLMSGAIPTSVSAQTLTAPEGLLVDGFGFLYVADVGASRVVVFPNAGDESESGPSAAMVLGQPAFETSSPGGGGQGLRGPRNVTADSSGNILVADTGNHRVVVFPPFLSLPIANGAASAVIGQPNLDTTRSNWNSADGLATPQGLFGPVGLFLDRNDTLYVGDTGNSRVVHFLRATTAVNAVHSLGGVPVAPGSLVTLWGEGFTGETGQAGALPLPRTLAGLQVEIRDGQTAPLLFASDRQINLQLPTDVPPGSHQVAVRRADTAELVAGDQVEIADAGPALFSVAPGGVGPALAWNQDSSFNSESNPASKGSVITLFGSGQGVVTPGVADGEPAPGGSLAHSVATPTSDGVACLTAPRMLCVAVGSTFGEVMFSGLAPGFVALWQMNVKIPDSEQVLTGSAVPVRVVINGRASNVVTLAIR